MKQLLIIDASGTLYAAYHAIQNMTNSRGESTNALFGFANSLQKLFKAFPAEHIAVVFDGSDNIASRKALDEGYKLHRTSVGEDLHNQVAWAQELCLYQGLPFLALPGVEADDVIASIAKPAAKEGYDVLICSTDKDLCQLVGKHIRLVNPRKDYQVVDAAAVEGQHGVPPHLMGDYLALLGDSSDNIPGVPGFGPKTAAMALLKAGSLEALLADPSVMKSPKKEVVLQENAERILLNRRLIALDDALELHRGVDSFAVQPPDIESLRAFYRNYDLHTLLRALPAAKETEAAPIACHSVEDKASWQSLVAALSKQPAALVMAAAGGTAAYLAGLTFAYSSEKAWYLPLHGAIDKADIIHGLEDLFASVSCYSYDVKALSHLLAAYHPGLKPKIIAGDILLTSQLLYAHQRQHSLHHLAEQHLGRHLPTLEEFCGKKKVNLASTDVEKIAAYFCQLACVAVSLEKILSAELQSRALKGLFEEVELPLVPILTAMEEQGIYLDSAMLQSLGQELALQLAALTEAAHALIGRPFNLNSPLQLAQILAESGIKTGKKTIHGTSTRAEELTKLRGSHPLIDVILQYRELEKLRSTYVDALPKSVNAATGRIHCTFNQLATSTGRLSCQDPNLQNIPIRTAIGRKVRAAFKPKEAGWSFLSADYSQIELRLLAHFSGEPLLLEAFNKGEDIHRYTAALLLGVPPEDVSEEQRYKAKAVNFGILYGQQAYGLSQGLSISMEEAGTFITTYFERYPKVKEYLDSCKESARISGKAVTFLGRERFIPEIHSPNGIIRSAAERLAVNTPIQGSAADLIKMAMLRVAKALAAEKLHARLLLQIHDELLLEAPDDEILKASDLVTEAMEHALSLSVPLIVNISIGKNWQAC